MLRSKATVFGMIALLVLMTGAFTAISAGDVERPQAAQGGDEFVTVNGEQIAEEDFLVRVASVEQSMMMLSAGEELGGLDEGVYELLQRTPAETIALASLILDMALFQEAVERGHLPDSEMISQQVEQERQIFEMVEEDPEQFGIDEAEVASYRENVDEIGEERYWNEYVPQIMEQQIAVQQLQMSVSPDGGDWFEVQRQVFDDAEVEIADPDRIAPATVPDARAYLDQLWGAYQNPDAS
jgi:hypothetical protein